MAVADERLQQAAEEGGFELAYSEDSSGEHFRGIRVFVKMSNRKLREEDRTNLHRVGAQIREDLDKVSAETDPKGWEKREAMRSHIADIFKDAGVEAIYMRPLPNGYCPRPCCLNKPWFRVTSKIGDIVIGWRKSVISIDWKGSDVQSDGYVLFPTENVTRWETGIHAHGRDKAVEYIRRLHEAKE